MPELPRYESRRGPERHQPYAPRQDYTTQAIAQGAAGIGQGLADIGQAIRIGQERRAAIEEERKAKEEAENLRKFRILQGMVDSLNASQAEAELGQAKNKVRQEMNNFQLSLNEDQDFAGYNEKYTEAADVARRKASAVLSMPAAEERFSAWWEETNEEERFNVAKLAQKKNLEWQVVALED